MFFQPKRFSRPINSLNDGKMMSGVASGLRGSRL